jgi:hypothetical protein
MNDIIKEILRVRSEDMLKKAGLHKDYSFSNGLIPKKNRTPEKTENPLSSSNDVISYLEVGGIIDDSN